MAQDHRIDHDGNLLYIALDPDGVWARSDFPDPLITVDYNSDDEVIGISAVDPVIGFLLDEYKRWRETDEPAQNLVNELGATAGSGIG
jgi:hypothetical protein